MANEGVDHGRRRFLTATTAVIGGVGVVAAAVPFIESWEPSARALSAGAPVTADISKIELGQMVRFAWRGLPVFVANRTKEQLADLPSLDPRLRDPKCEEDQQPSYCKNTWRSIKPEWLVMIGICTHLGCVPDYYGEIRPEPFDAHWKGGYFCPCHKSRYDVSGRVFQGVPAPLNMVIPPYHFIDDTHVRIGVSPKGAA
ncbi:MAG: ubiquinol-cytochrome c reductase iron-sulfur subunit [Xanthomonadaceae bacterium]|nr:ubiquinol-cytochrome c reductase iron-sulfur subunit [Xanthomonadaceae bacterium]MDE1957716.1 ubiquinol-cytochrome c reductase iron-sulfur subunit [Xanthomonadaceae bacterium]MDE2177196.1 ubiquinol-cytochrome c reductase iron-sulfur subunit [Xanthomonadaceae bacterium]MDE2244580.1 ubiquinol-cytochrome c reductase iron-sulfur subunit [Xanthomonadaceae bacterium]